MSVVWVTLYIYVVSESNWRFCFLCCRCSLKSECTNADDTLRWLPYSNSQCTNITKVIPEQVQRRPNGVTEVRSTKLFGPNFASGEKCDKNVTTERMTRRIEDSLERGGNNANIRFTVVFTWVELCKLLLVHLLCHTFWTLIPIVVAAAHKSGYFWFIAGATSA